ncbi:hypothetical protein K144313037_05720 [Clostridium tetani]|uniref:Uncharacterized protein n=1 Tax=Clostridium tetani TaxID=1513 RepID=A0A4Q0UZJ5_CLOTA|nr:hypothetical protein [Clostridium tetani]CDI48813.1 hypothetical protein BN906_00795 [Clostridium tetani 12124569]AVP55725.1 hypothetical protein C3B72_11495 [Clostridium tetani]KGI40632.1 hypothetical protein LA33_08360 [Clostridium tetani ATCC 9441]KGI41365.1 hypothetical protein KY52_00150 [Clostridium tetani]KGI42113.1 hypothetical protein KY55_10865 [Clostridium tetani]
MKNNQSNLNILFVLVTLITIVSRSFDVGSIFRIILLAISIIMAIPYFYILVKNKMYKNNLLNLFAAILVFYQIINIIYYTYVLKIQ